MNSSVNIEQKETLVRSAVYELLSVAFLYPEEGRVELLRDGVQRLETHTSELGWQQLADALRQVDYQLNRLSDAGLEKEYISVFGHTISTDCPPYETEYDQAHVFQKSQTLADLSTFYQAFGVGLNPDLKERLDHISVEMEFMNLLAAKEAYAYLHYHGEDKVNLCRQAQTGFLAAHLADWIKSFVHRLKERTGGAGIYARVDQVLDLHMDREFERFSIDTADFNPVEVPETREDELDCAACPLAADTPQGVRVV